MTQTQPQPVQASPQQQAVYQWIKYGSGNAIVVAVAGSGKTTTLVNSMKYTTGTVAFAAFNKKIADEIKARTSDLPNVTAGTFHSFGNRALRSIAPGSKLDSNKTYKIMDEALTPKAMMQFVKKAVSLAKQMGFGVTECPDIDDHYAWQTICDHFDIWDDLPNYISPDQAIVECIKITQKSTSLDLAKRIIDFDDMIWLPLLHNAKIPTYSWVMVDEAQDSNVMRRIFAERMMAKDSRLIAVGDPHQAIYGFSGAMSDSLDTIKDRLACTELPLTVSFRCPQTVVAVAQQWVSHIEAAPNAAIGTYLNYSDPVPADQNNGNGDVGAQMITRMMPWMIENDRQLLAPYTAILCRTTAPLVSLAYRFIGEMIACHVEGRDIGQGLIKLIKKFATFDRSIDMYVALQEYATKQYSDWTELKQYFKISQLEDKMDTIAIIMENPKIGPLTSDIIRAIEQLFADTEPGKERPDVTLCTIHRSKGREWDRVIWLGRNQLQPSKWATKAAGRSEDGEHWTLDQETNLMYVAATRARSELIEVDIAK